jgi:hypothetical protein
MKEHSTFKSSVEISNDVNLVSAKISDWAARNRNTVREA